MTPSRHSEMPEQTTVSLPAAPDVVATDGSDRYATD
jgi:hypothetical protein